MNFEWDALLAEIQSNKVIPVIGEDLLQVTLPGSESSYYRLLAQRLASKLNVDLSGLPESYGMPDVLIANPEFVNKLIRTPVLAYSQVASVNKAMLEEFGNDFPIPDALQRLAAISNFNLFVTLTVDRLLDVALQRARGVTPISLVNKRESTPDIDKDPQTKPVIFKLLGQFCPQPEYALTDEDILEFMCCLIKPENRPRNLFYALSQNSLLIMGTRFPDWLTRFFLRATRGSERLRVPRDYTQYVVDPNISSDAKLVGFLRNFSSSTVHVEADPRAFVQELHERCRELGLLADRPAQPSKTDAPDVFLSYAGEDREAAQRIRDSLEGHDVQVWMDTNPQGPNGLEAGEQWNQEIRRKIQEAGLFVAVYSEHTASRKTQRGRYFRAEWKLAYERLPEFFGTKRRFVLPLVVSGTNPLEPYLGPEQFKPFQPTLARNGELPPDFVASVKRELAELQSLS